MHREDNMDIPFGLPKITEERCEAIGKKYLRIYKELLKEVSSMK